MRLASFFVLLALILAACDSDALGPDPDTPEGALVLAREAWEDEGPNDYTITHYRDCFCLADEIVYVVTVEDGEAVAATADGATVALGNVQYKTVEDLFGIVEDALDREADSLAVEYDAFDGHPTSIYADYDFGVADEELEYLFVTAFEPR